jgi:hypothetical protein
LVINEEIIKAFEGSDAPDKLSLLINRLLNLEDGGKGRSTNPDAVASLIEGILEKTGSINDDEFLEWCKNNAR